MCNCMKEKIQYVKEHYKEIPGAKGWDIEDVEFKHTLGIFLSHLNIPVVIKGKNSKGKAAKKELYYPALCCPFCGKPYHEKEGGKHE